MNTTSERVNRLARPRHAWNRVRLLARSRRLVRLATNVHQPLRPKQALISLHAHADRSVSSLEVFAPTVFNEAMCRYTSALAQRQKMKVKKDVGQLGSRGPCLLLE